MPAYQEEDDSYLKGTKRKDEDESVHPLKKKVYASKGKSMMNNPKKKALKSALTSLSSGANFRNQ